jgi:hypothetical protein
MQLGMHNWGRRQSEDDVDVRQAESSLVILTSRISTQFNQLSLELAGWLRIANREDFHVWSFMRWWDVSDQPPENGTYHGFLCDFAISNIRRIYLLHVQRPWLRGQLTVGGSHRLCVHGYSGPSVLIDSPGKVLHEHSKAIKNLS